MDGSLAVKLFQHLIYICSTLDFNAAGEHARAEYWRRQVERPRPDALKGDLALLCAELRACFSDLGYFPSRAELRAALRWDEAMQLRLSNNLLFV
jgi:hypothetical protein